MAGTNLDKMIIKCDGDAGMAGLLCDAGLDTPGRVWDASDEDIEEAVGSENLAAVRTLFPARQE